jgi:hypothetical protein
MRGPRARPCNRANTPRQHPHLARRVTREPTSLSSASAVICAIVALRSPKDSRFATSAMFAAPSRTNERAAAAALRLRAGMRRGARPRQRVGLDGN